MTALPLWLWAILGWISAAVGFLAWLWLEVGSDDRRADDLLPTDDLMDVADSVQTLFTAEDLARLRAIARIQASEVQS